MRRIFDFLMNNIREHLMLYIFLWCVLLLLDLIYIVFL